MENEEVNKYLTDAGLKVTVGKDEVLKAIKEASDNSIGELCSGYRIFPDGRRCKGCPDCLNYLKESE